MTSRPKLLRSGLQILIQDQKRVTASFHKWKEDRASSTASVAPIVASTYRRLQRDLDRLLVLAESYGIDDEFDRSDRASVPVSEEHSSPDASRLPAVSPTITDILQEGYEALERLSTRYASVYCMATTVMEPAVANVAHSNLKGIRDMASKVMGALALVTVEEVTEAHPSLVVNVTAGSRARDFLQTLWAPNVEARDAADEVTEVVAERSESQP